MRKKTKFTKTQGHHCWWLNIHGEPVAKFNHEIDVDDLVMAGNIMPKLYAALDKFISLVDDDSSEDFLYKYQEIKELLAEARGE